MRFQFINKSGRTVPRRFLIRWCDLLAKYAKSKVPAKSMGARELVIVFLNSRDAQELNHRFRRKNYATDVLSFSSDDPEALGDLVICPEVISRQAREHGFLVREELGYMIIHGFLHLLGFDHERSKREAEKMFKIQDELFEQIGSRFHFRATARQRVTRSSPKKESVPKGKTHGTDD